MSRTEAERGERHPVALVTGASSGIGAAFASRLAGRGFDLVVLGRREPRLRELAARLERAHDVTVEVCVADLASMVDVEQVARKIRGLDRLDLLVNNAGFGTSTPFAESDLHKQLDMIRVHVLAPVALTRAALEGMLTRRRGGIINVSSVAGWLARPGNTNYAATKSYLTTFTVGLAGELRGSGIQVQALCPGLTRTEFHDSPEYAEFDRRRIPGFLWMTADEVAARSLRGLDTGRVVLVPGWQNRVIVRLARTALGRWVMRSSRFALRNRRT
jgi:short-subunit dehydrogenase